MEVTFFVVVLAVLRNDAIVISARLFLRPEVVVLDSSNIFDFWVGGGSWVDQLRPRLVNLNVTYEFLDRVAVKFRFVWGSVRNYVYFGRCREEVRSWCSLGVWGRQAKPCASFRNLDSALLLPNWIIKLLTFPRMYNLGNLYSIRHNLRIHDHLFAESHQWILLGYLFWRQ